MIRFSCPICTQRLSAADRQSGCKIECPSCRQRLRIPNALASCEYLSGDQRDTANGSGREGPAFASPPAARPDPNTRYVIAAAFAVVCLKVLALLIPVIILILILLIRLSVLKF